MSRPTLGAIRRQIGILLERREIAVVFDEQEEVDAAIQALKWTIGEDLKPPRETFEP